MCYIFRTFEYLHSHRGDIVFFLCACTLPATIIKNKALKVKTYYVSSYKNGVRYAVNVGQYLPKSIFIKESLCTQV